MLHGPWLAGLGLLAAYVTPFLVRSDEPNSVALLGYLVCVSASAAVLERVRGWRWLLVASQGAAILWVPLVIATTREPYLDVGLYGLALAAIAFGPEILFGAEGRPARRAAGVAAGQAAVMFAVAAGGDWSGTPLVLALLFVGVLLAGAFRAAPLGGLVPVAGIFSCALLAAWTIPWEEPRFVGGLVQPDFGLPPLRPETVQTFGLTGMMAGTLFFIAGFFGAWRGAAATWLAGGAAVAPVALLAIAYLQIAGFEPSYSFALLALGLAAVLAFATEACVRTPPRRSGHTVLGLFAAGSIAALCLGLAVVLEKGWLTVALALTSLALAGGA